MVVEAPFASVPAGFHVSVPDELVQVPLAGVQLTNVTAYPCKAVGNLSMMVIPLAPAGPLFVKVTV